MDWLAHARELAGQGFEAAQFWNGYEGPLLTAGTYALGIALYGILVWKLLGRLAARHPLGLPPRSGTFWRRAGVYVRLVVVFPLLCMLYLAFLSAALFVLAKNQGVPQILLVSVSLIGGIRVAAWLHEEAARDIAKIVPLGLLGFVIVDPGIISLSVAWTRFLEAPAMAPVVLRYFLVLVLIEGVAQAILSMIRPTRRLEVHEKPPRELRPVKAIALEEIKWP